MEDNGNITMTRTETRFVVFNGRQYKVYPTGAVSMAYQMKGETHWKLVKSQVQATAVRDFIRENPQLVTKELVDMNRRAPRMLILNIGQCEAVYNAMCALNNVGGRIKCSLEYKDPLNMINVFEREDGTVSVVVVVQASAVCTEDYADQHDFARTYGMLRD